MAGSFGGGDYIRDQFPESYEEYAAKKEGREPDPCSKFVTFDNTVGEVVLRLPPELSEHQGELLSDLYEEFFSAPAGDPTVLEAMNGFVSDWLQKRTGRNL